MKTTDLIPIILYQLVDGDKYGYEIVKQIEDTSNGKITIKQPTLYSVLKKLEHGKFISSYWQDSEIGGKRHYYKLTENGKAQLDTYPSFEQLIKDAVDDNDPQPNAVSSPAVEGLDTLEDSTAPIEKEEPVSNLDEKVVEEVFINTYQNSKEDVVDNVIGFDEDSVIKPIKIDLTSPISVYSDNSHLDTSLIESNQEDIVNLTSDQNCADISPINDEVVVISNKEDDVLSSEPSAPISIFDAIEPANCDSEFIKSKSTSSIETSNIDTEEDDTKVKELVETIAPTAEPTINNKLYEKLVPNKDLIDSVEPSVESDETPILPIEVEEKVKYLDYVNLSTDKASIKRKTAIVKQIQKMSLTCFSLLIMLVISLVVASNYAFGKLYYVSAIIVALAILFYPIILLKNVPKIRLKYCSKPFKYYVSRDFLIKLTLFLSLIIIIFAYNIGALNSIKAIFGLNNFANFVAPIMFSCGLLLDFVYGLLLYKDYTK